MDAGSTSRMGDQARPGGASVDVLVYEDRADHFVGVKLLVLSLARHAPGARIHVVAPNLSEQNRVWLAQHPQVKVIHLSTAQTGFNVKPSLLIQALDRGLDPVVWVDSDVIAAADPMPLFARASPAPLIVSQETYWGERQGGVYRTRAWGLPVGRRMPATVNTGVLGVTGEHRGLLEEWAEMLQDARYVGAQRLAGVARPLHLLTDQDVLTALLGSRRWADVPLAWLHRGRDIVQQFGPGGYTVSERVRNVVMGGPVLVHCMGRKPYVCHSPPRRIRDDVRTYYDRVWVELSPYMSVAREYREGLGEDASWMDGKTAVARAMSAGMFGQRELRGAMLAAVDGCVRPIRRVMRGKQG